MVSTRKLILYSVRRKGPVAKTTIKYNTKGFAKKEMFENINVDSRYTHFLAGATNMALTDATKSQYKTAVKHIERVEVTLGVDMSSHLMSLKP